MKLLLVTLIAFVVFPGLTKGQVKATNNTLKLAEGQSSEAATIADVAQLSGNWTGTGLGGVSEEIWSKPAAGVMMGMYRLIREDKPAFYEMLWLAEENGTLILRLKHFHANLVGLGRKGQDRRFQVR